MGGEEEAVEDRRGLEGGAGQPVPHVRRRIQGDDRVQTGGRNDEREEKLNQKLSVIDALQQSNANANDAEEEKTEIE